MKYFGAVIGVLLGATLAIAGEPQAVFSARVPTEASLTKLLDDFAGARVVYRSADADQVRAVFVAADRRLSETEHSVVKRLSGLSNRDLSLYRVRFGVRYGALALPKGDGCLELDGPLGLDEDLDPAEREACMNKWVRESLVKATDEAARSAAQKQIATVLFAFLSTTDNLPPPIVVSRRVRTFLVRAEHGERQEAEVEVIFVALTWSRPFDLAVQRPVVNQTLERLSSLGSQPSSGDPGSLVPQGPRADSGLAQGVGD